MRLTRVILTALAVSACLPSVGSAQYAPTWHVGDWWVIKTFEQSDVGFDGWAWNQTR